MADFASFLLHATVIWFESLEFMSLGYRYDMALLLIGDLNGGRIETPMHRRGHMPILPSRFHTQEMV
jgi:hypothetical protein